MAFVTPPWGVNERIFVSLRVCLVGGVEKWEDEKLVGWWKSGRMEKWEDRKDLVIPYMCLVGGVEKWKGGKLFNLVGEIKGRMENIVYIN